MNPTRFTGYEERLRRVTQHIHQHLDEPLDLNRLAEVACLSPYHWHRIYHGVHGETAAATVKRLRLQRAAFELAHSATSVAAIAARAGYPSVASFTRVFGGAYGMPPAEYRRAGGHTQYQSPISTGETKMFDVQLRQLPAVQAVTLAHQGSYMKIGQAFETLFATFAPRGLVTPSTRSLGIYYDDPNAVPEKDLRSCAAIVVDRPVSVEAPFALTAVPGGEHAVLRHKGPYSDLHVAYQWLYGTWLAQAGREVADQPIFEEYLNDPRNTPPAELLTEICLPLRAV